MSISRRWIERRIHSSFHDCRALTEKPFQLERIWTWVTSRNPSWMASGNTNILFVCPACRLSWRLPKCQFFINRYFTAPLLWCAYIIDLILWMWILFCRIIAICEAYTSRLSISSDLWLANFIIPPSFEVSSTDGFWCRALISAWQMFVLRDRLLYSCCSWNIGRCLVMVPLSIRYKHIESAIPLTTDLVRQSIHM